MNDEQKQKIIKEEFYVWYSQNVPNKKNLEGYRIADWWLSKIDQVVKEERGRIEKILIEEINIARVEGQSTSRLTSAFNKITHINK